MKKKTKEEERKQETKKGQIRWPMNLNPRERVNCPFYEFRIVSKEKSDGRRATQHDG